MTENVSHKRLSWRTLGLPVYAVLVILIIVGVFFLVELLTFDPRVHEAAEPVSATSYADEVAALLANADPSRGDALAAQYNCIACHRAGAANGIAPPFVGIAERAAERRPPMPAAAYLYESIIHPSAYIVPKDDEELYPDAMLRNFGETISDRDLGDLIAWLLSGEAY
jgi:mono/diheme cytochrome c family protein